MTNKYFVECFQCTLKKRKIKLKHDMSFQSLHTTLKFNSMCDGEDGEELIFFCSSHLHISKSIQNDHVNACIQQLFRIF